MPRFSTVLLLLAAAGPAAAQTAKAPERLKDFLGDPLPERALLRIGTTRLQHATPIQSLAVSDDGRLLASCGYDKVVQVWDARDGKPLWRFDLPYWGDWGLAFSQDGKELTGASRSFSEQKRPGSFLRWDLTNGKALGQARDGVPRFDSSVVSVALVSLPDGAYLMAETAGPNITLRSPGVMKADKDLLGDAGRVMSVSFTRDAKTLVSLGEDGIIRLWDVADGKAMGKIKLPALGDSLRGNMAAIAVAPDAKVFAVCLPLGVTLILDAKGQLLRRLPWPGARTLEALTFSPDGKHLYTGNTMVRCWQVETGKEITLVNAPRMPVVHMALAPDGKTVAWADADDDLRLADVATGKTLFHTKLACSSCIAFSPTGKYLAAGERGDKDRAAGEQGGKDILLWDVAKLRTLGRTPPGEPAAVFPCQNVALDFAFSPNGKRLATVERDGVARIYEIASKQCILTLTKPFRVVTIRWSADGNLLWTMGEARAVNGEFGGKRDQYQCSYLWDASTGKEVAGAKELGLSAHTVAFHPNGRVLAAIHFPVAAPVFFQALDAANPGATRAEDRMEAVRLWDIKSATERLRFEDPVQRRFAEEATARIIGRSRPQPAAFSPDGRLFAAPGAAGIVMYETVTGRPRLRLQGHLQEAVAFAFTPDSKALVSASPDSTLLVWDLTGLKTTGNQEGTAEELWKLLADGDAERAGRAVWAMVSAPQEALRVLRKSLKPVVGNPKLLAKLIDDLDAPKFAVREQAMHELALRGPAVEEALAAKLQDRPTLEVRRRIEKLLETIRTGQPSPQQLQVVRGVEVLEHIGTPEARAWLDELAKGDQGTWATRQAREALVRLEAR
jgi:WD40 repeat protein